MLLEMLPNLIASQFIGYLKMIFNCNTNLKYKYENSHFWCIEYYVYTVGGNQNTIKEYIDLFVGR